MGAAVTFIVYSSHGCPAKLVLSRSPKAAMLCQSARACLDSRVLRYTALNERTQQRLAALSDVVHKLEETQGRCANPRWHRNKIKFQADWHKEVRDGGTILDAA